MTQNKNDYWWYWKEGKLEPQNKLIIPDESKLTEQEYLKLLHDMNEFYNWNWTEKEIMEKFEKAKKSNNVKENQY